MLEIERKFLVKSDFKSQVSQKFDIIQAYICNDPNKTVRIRIKSEQAFITIKGKSNKSGTTRFEWEKEIPLNEAYDLLKLCDNGYIEKIRHIIIYKGKKFEVDEFFGVNKGLILAEIELNNENDHFDRPEWLGEEVTGDIRYYNSNLLTNPYSQW
ncbi:MAG: CYTH domain-containing protein [Marinifilaceae bacterium]|jgi:adenylate cyclase|nr:CYTH domain-containing protein [Marinifilaceae bacterium]